MKFCTWCKFTVLVWLPVLFVAGNSAAQGSIAVVAGQRKSLAVLPGVGDTYAWRVFSKPTFLTVDLATPEEVEYDTGSSQPVLPALWKKQGDFYFTVTVFNQKGCKNMKVGYVKVISPAIQAIAGRDTVVGICSSMVLDASKSIGNALTYHWDMLDAGGLLLPNNGAIVSLTISPTYSGGLPLNIRVKLTVTDKFGATAMDTIKITFMAPPIVGIVYPTSPNKDGSMLIDGRASTGLGLKYQWNATKGEIIGDANKPMVLIRGAGLYSLEVTDAFGCKSLKIFQFPFEQNDLIANDDYVRTSWLDSIHIHVLNNDYDSKNDIDKGTLTVTKKPSYGSTLVNPDGSIIYTPSTHKAVVDQFTYQICDSSNVCGSALVTVEIFDGPVWIPEAISVNGDGHNESFVIRGLENFQNSSLMIYTRAGQLVYKSLDYKNDWAGKAQNSSLSDGVLLPTATYYYVLHLGGTSRYIKGFVYLTY